MSQCPLQWQPGDPIPFVYGDARATLVIDPDGPDPSPTVLVDPAGNLVAVIGTNGLSLTIGIL